MGYLADREIPVRIDSAPEYHMHKKYVQEFEKLWKQFDKNEVEGDQRRVHNNSRHNNRRNNNNNNKRRYNDGNDHDNKNNHNEGDQQQHHGRGGHTKKPNIVEQGK